ncbi:MAG: ABC transporter permease [Firmicutes bacterium]|jgi:peptide/nickel transport system permease protein|nr:ABC transporter permease [Bacillota bacterium]
MAAAGAPPPVAARAPVRAAAPAVRATHVWRRRLRTNPLFAAGMAILTVFVLAGLAAPWLAPHDPIAVDAQGMFQPPSRLHPFGTDRFGRDLFSRVLYGIRVSLGIAVLAIGMAAVAGGMLGLVAGYAERAVDQVLGRVMDVFFAFPSVLLALGISAVLGAGVTTVIIAIAVVYAPLFFRVMRGSVLAEKHLAYVEAAAAVGAGPWTIMTRHILRNCLSPMIVQIAVSLSYAILIESALSYLGVGVQPPTPSWGTILNEGKEFLPISPWISLFPGLFIMLSVLSLNFISDGLRDYLDPRVSG